MPTNGVWRIVTGDEYQDEYARLFISAGVIAVGWSRLGNIEKLSREEIFQKAKDKGIENPSYATSTLLRFRDEIENGDLIIAYKTRNKVAAVGIVRSKYFFDNSDELGGEEWRYPHKRKVEWMEAPRDFDRRLLGDDLSSSLGIPGTLHFIEYDRELLEEKLKEISKIPPEEIKEVTYAWNEDQIKDYIERRPEDLESGLKIEKREYGTTVGDADFFARDKDGNPVIIEVKVDAKDSVIGQILGYMNAYEKESGKKARGIIVAQHFDERVKTAAMGLDLTLFKCDIKFSFSKLQVKAPIK